MAKTRGQQDKRFAPETGYTNQPVSIFAGAKPGNSPAFTTSNYVRAAPVVKSQGGLSRAQQNYASKQASALMPFQEAMKNITPGMLQSPSGTAKKATTTAAKKSTTPTKAAVARKVVGSGAAKAATPAAKPVDPLESLRGEYDKYLQDIYGGLTTSLEGERAQYQTRSNELVDRLKAGYADANTLAAGTADRTGAAMQEYAQRMGLQQAAPTAAEPWIATNERLKALNGVAQNQSLQTNDLIRTNYYDFLGDKVSSAKGSEATSRAGLNDVIAQAILARQQAAQAAAAAASRARSSRGRGGGKGGSSGGLKGSTTLSSSNDVLAQLMQMDPIVRNAQMSLHPLSAAILDSGVSKNQIVNAGPYSGGQTSGIYRTNVQGADYYNTYLPAAVRAFAASGVGGNAVSKTTTKIK